MLINTTFFICTLKGFKIIKGDMFNELFNMCNIYLYCACANEANIDVTSTFRLRAVLPFCILSPKGG